MLKSIKSESYLSTITDGYLSQSELIDDDFLLLRDNSGFERILIFDRPECHKDYASEHLGEPNVNVNK